MSVVRPHPPPPASDLPCRSGRAGRGAASRRRADGLPAAGRGRSPPERGAERSDV